MCFYFIYILGHTFKPDSLTSTFGQVVNIRSDVTIDTTNNRWIINGLDVEPVEMALRTIIRGGSDCVANNFEIIYDIAATSISADAGIIISAGSEYMSFLFDFDGYVIIGGGISTGGVGIYPGCGNRTLPLIPNNGIDSGALFSDNQDTNPNEDDAFYNWRDRMAGGTRNNWQALDATPVYEQDSFRLSFNILSFDTMEISFKAGLYSATCVMNTPFSYTNGNDIYVDFSPDFESSETWQISSITVTTDCSAGI